MPLYTSAILCQTSNILSDYCTCALRVPQSIDATRLGECNSSLRRQARHSKQVVNAGKEEEEKHGKNIHGKQNEPTFEKRQSPPMTALRFAEDEPATLDPRLPRPASFLEQNRLTITMFGMQTASCQDNCARSLQNLAVWLCARHVNQSIKKKTKIDFEKQLRKATCKLDFWL